MNSINVHRHYNLVSEDTIINSDNSLFVNLKYQLKNNNENIEKERNVLMKQKEIGIITILDEETQAVIEKLKLIKQPSKFGQRIYYTGELEGEETIHQVVLTQQLNQGQESVISAYNDLTQKFAPKLFF